MNNIERSLPVQFMVIIAGCIFTAQVSEGYDPLASLGDRAVGYALTGWSKSMIVEYGNAFLGISTADYLPPSPDLPCYRVVAFRYGMAGRGPTMLKNFLTECYTPDSSAGVFVHTVTVRLRQQDGSVVNEPVNFLRYFNKAVFRMISDDIKLVFRTEENPEQCMKHLFAVDRDGKVFINGDPVKVACSQDLDILPTLPNFVLSPTGGVGTFQPAGEWTLVNPWAVGYATREYFRDVADKRLCYRLVVILVEGMFAHAAKLTCGELKGVTVADDEFLIDYAVRVQKSQNENNVYLVDLNSRNDACWHKKITFQETSKGVLRKVLWDVVLAVTGRCQFLVQSNAIPRTIAQGLEKETPSGVFPNNDELKQFTTHSQAYTYDYGGIFGIVVQTSDRADGSKSNIVTTYVGLGSFSKPVMPVIVDARSDRHIVTQGAKILYGTDVAVQYDSGTTIFEVLVRVDGSKCKRTKFSVTITEVKRLPDLSYDPDVDAWSDGECKALIEGAHLSHNDELQFEEFEKEIDDHETLYWWP